MSRSSRENCSAAGPSRRVSGFPRGQNQRVGIDAVSIAYAYCEAVFPDKAVRAALQSSKELRTIGTFVPRRPEELTDWLSVLPTVVAPDLLLPHPIPRPVS